MTQSLVTRIPHGSVQPFQEEMTAGSEPQPDLADLLGQRTSIEGPTSSGEGVVRYLKAQAKVDEASRGRAVDLRVLMARLEGVPFDQASAMLRTSPGKLARWLQGVETVPAKKSEAIRDLNRIVLDLGRVLDPVAFSRWFNAPNPKLGGLTPYEKVKRRETTDVLKAVAAYLEPTFG
ncbi:hypothetical protein [Blastococcus sp. SYSU D00695]